MKVFVIMENEEENIMEGLLKVSLYKKYILCIYCRDSTNKNDRSLELQVDF